MLAGGVHFLATLKFSEDALLSPSRKTFQIAKLWKLAYRNPFENKFVVPFGIGLAVASFMAYMMPILNVVRKYYRNAFAGEIFLMICEMSPNIFTLGYVGASLAAENPETGPSVVLANILVGVLLYCILMVVYQRIYGTF